jgi:divalent metal cation (Fe/Co/Zn/Cd) transporter
MNPASSKTVIYAAIAGNLLIALAKFATASYTGSAAMFSEAIHSLIDTGNQGLLLYGLKCAARPPTPSHPFGYGLQLYFVLGFSLALETVIWVIALMAFNKVRGGMGWIEAIKNSKDPTLFTVLFEDTAAMLGLIVALAGTYFSQTLNMPALDGVASVMIGIILALTAVFLARESHSLLTGEAASPLIRAGIRSIATSEPGVELANEILTMHFGPRDILVALSLDFESRLTAVEVEEAVSRIEKRIKAAHPEVTRVFVEAQSLEAHRRGLSAT